MTGAHLVHDYDTEQPPALPPPSIVALTSLAAENAKNAFSDINGESAAEWPAVLRADDAESSAGQAAERAAAAAAQ